MSDHTTALAKALGLPGIEHGQAVRLTLRAGAAPVLEVDGVEQPVQAKVPDRVAAVVSHFGRIETKVRAKPQAEGKGPAAAAAHTKRGRR